jgi:hypothetical protein
MQHTPPSTPTRSLSFVDFRNDLRKQGYRVSTNFGWLSDAYLLYLGSKDDRKAVGGFNLLLNWWARDDRRELEGLPRSDPLTTKLTAVLRWLAQYIASRKGLAYRVAAKKNLSAAILKLNSWMDEHHELTAADWQLVHQAYERTVAIETLSRRQEMLVVV